MLVMIVNYWWVILEFNTLGLNKMGAISWNACHYSDVIMGTIASQITSLTVVYSTVYSDADQRKYQSSASLAFVWGIHRRPVNSPHKWPVTRKMFPFDDVIMAFWLNYQWGLIHIWKNVWPSVNRNTLVQVSNDEPSTEPKLGKFCNATWRQ